MPRKKTMTLPSSYPGGLSRRDVVAWRNAVCVIFALTGVGLASWMARAPAVRDALDVNLEQLGILLVSIAVGSIVGLLASSHVIARFGARATILWSLIGLGIGLAVAGVGVTIFGSFAFTFIGLVIAGASMGMCDVAMNVSGAANERVLGHAIMPIFHAFFSIGTIIGALLGALAALWVLPIAWHIGLIGLVLAAAAPFVVRGLRSEHLMAEGYEEAQHDVPQPGDHAATWRGRLSIWRRPQTLLIGLIVLGMAFAEGSANDWIALAMVDGHGVDDATAALVLGVFVTAMTVGRLLGVTVLDRFGRVPVLQTSAALAVIGLLVVIFVPNPWIAIVGVVMWGLGSALGFPVGMSAAADNPRTAAARVSAVATIGYFAFLVGPPLIGFLGERVGILNALLCVLVLVAVSGVVSPAAREPRPADS